MMWNSSIKSAIGLWFFLFFLGSYVGATTISEKKVTYDSAAIVVKKIPSGELEKLQADEDYRYVRTIISPPKTAWERFKEWFWKKINDLFDNKTGNLTIRIITYLVVAAAIFFLVFLMLKNDARFLFYKKGSMIATDFTESIQDIQEMDFDKIIAEEVERRNFRKAVRLYFLKVIKELDQHQLISWKLDKTNTDYLRELKNGTYHQKFAELIRLYEYIWYGDFKLDETNFLTVIQKFNQFRINQES